MPVTFTTDLPDVDSLPLDASVEDQLTAEPSATPSLNHGVFRTEYRETGTSAWLDAGTTPYDAPDNAITGLLDGEKYDVRVRTETADVTGAWFETDDITLLPAPSNLATANITKTSVDLSWGDNADNEDDYTVRRRRADRSTWIEVATLAPDTTAYSDTSVQPGRTYDYVVRVETEHVYADSATVTASTTATGVPQTRTRRSGWTVEIEHPDGAILRPEVVDTVDATPVVNDLPRISIPVPDEDRYATDVLRDQLIHVWYEGQQLPVDTLVANEPEPGQVTLEAVGGTQLKEYVTSEINEGETHVEIRDLIQSHTDYATNVDEPNALVRENVLLYGASDGPDFRDLFDIGDETPVTINGSGDLVVQQTGWFSEGESGGTNTDVPADSTGQWSNGIAALLENIGDSVTVSVDNDYRIPAGAAEVRLLVAFTGDDSPGLEARWDGETATIPAGAYTQDTDEYEIEWINPFVFNDAKPAGSGTVEVEITDPSSGDMYVDAIWAGDISHTYLFDSVVDADDVIDGPQLYPDDVTVETRDIFSVARVVGGRLELSITDTSNGQAVAVSNNGGETWTEAGNTTAVETDFAAASQRLRGRVTLSRTDDTRTTGSPARGYLGQEVSELRLEADLDETPVLLDKQQRGRLTDVVTTYARDGNFFWELRRDPAADYDDPTGYVFEMTQAGQRERAQGRLPEVVDYSGRKTEEGSYERIVVFGSSEDVSTTFSTSGYGAGVTIRPPDGVQWVVPGSETVTDTNGEEPYERGTDYEMDYQSGLLTPLSEGDMTEDTTYDVEFRFKYRGEAAVESPTNLAENTYETTVASATSDLACKQIARGTLRRVDEALEEVTVTVANDDPTLSMLDALSYPELPFDAAVPRSKSVQPGRVQQELGNRRTVSDVVDDLRDGLEAVADQV